jgi:N-methylhydantoinase A
MIGMAWRIGIDIGGTFTDVALVEDKSGSVGVAKVPTTPDDLASGVLIALKLAMERHRSLRPRSDCCRTQRPS